MAMLLKTARHIVLPSLCRRLRLLTLAATLIVSAAAASASAAEPALSSWQAKQLLARTSFGHTPQSIEQLQQQGFEAWLAQQLALPRGRRLLNRTVELALMAEPNEPWFNQDGFTPPRGTNIRTHQNSAWWEFALTEPDQLRQRIAFALSQIIVVSSESEPFFRARADALAAWYDLLLDHALGNYRELLSAVSYSPAMGIFLSHHGNKIANPEKGSSPDENYARELMQLFSLGLYQLNERGEPILDKQGEKIPTYTQRDVASLARVFTGWDIMNNAGYGHRNRYDGAYTTPMEHDEAHYDNGEKTLLGETIPSGLSGPDAVEAALDILFKQPSVAPFITHQLIQRLVSSNPSPDYIQRVAAVFNDNGEGVKGDLAATVRAILLDPEALDNLDKQQPFKLKEPVLVLTGLLRALDVKPAKPFQYKDKGMIHGAYWFNRLKIGQNPLMAPSVFNDYEPDFQPMSAGFRNSGQVAPEAQVINSQNLSEMSNLIHWLLYVRTPHYETHRKAKQLQSIKKNTWRSPVSFSLTLSTLFAQLEQALEGDQNGDFKTLTQAKHQAKRQAAIDGLIDTLATQLLDKPMSAQDHRLVQQTLLKVAYKNPKRESVRLVFDAIRLLTLLPSHWVQR